MVCRGEPWRLLVQDRMSGAQWHLALEEAVARHVGWGRVPPTLMLWRSRKTFVLGRFDGKLPGYAPALARLRGSGVGLARRKSGGRAILQDAGFLNVSLALPRTPDGDPSPAPEEAYRMLSSGLIDGLRELGVRGRLGRLPGSFCDGPHNILAGTRKVGGSAQLRCRDFVLAHAVVFASGDLFELLELGREFYRLAGGDDPGLPDALATLEQVLNRTPVTWEETCRALKNGYRRTRSLRPGLPLKSEWELARKLEPAYSVSSPAPMVSPPEQGRAAGNGGLNPEESEREAGIRPRGRR